MENEALQGGIRTDLAMERCRADSSLEGADYTEETVGEMRLHRLSITTKEAAEAIGKPCGRYVTLLFSPLYELTEESLAPIEERLAALISEFAAALCPGGVTSLLCVGLGNRYLTSDAIGPESIRRMFATRHLKKEAPEIFSRFAGTEISLFAPGVMAQTGVEAAALVKKVAEASEAKLILVIDSLAARSPSRLATTIQLTDTGIRPASGISEGRLPIDSESMGVPVLALGVPSVVAASTFILDALEEAGHCELLRELEDTLAKDASFFVSPKDSDLLTERASLLIAGAVNRTFSAGFFET